MSRKINPNIEKIAKLLKSKRVEVPVTQIELAKSIKASQSRISKIEGGMGIDDLIFWLNYLDKLNIKPEFILNKFNTKSL